MSGFFTSSEKQKQIIIHNKLPQCGKCGLYARCSSPKMPPTGKGRKSILFVAEAPGSEEDRRGVQLIGDSGKLLRKALHEINFDLDDAWKTNVVICRPPNNKIEKKYIQCCRPNLLKTIRELKPNVIVALGAMALESLLQDVYKESGKKKPLSAWVGYQIPVREYNAWLCPTWHPSYLLRTGEDELQMRMFKDHLRNAISLENKEPNYLKIEDLKNKVKILTSEKRIIKILKKFSLARGILTFDYETTGIKPDHKDQKIYSVSLCLNSGPAYAFLLLPKFKPYLSKVLKNPRLKKVAANCKFEERWSIAKLGICVKNWYWDTMQQAHIIDNRKGITGLKFQAFVQFGIGDYDSHLQKFLKSSKKHGSNGLNKIEQAPVDELLLYNGLDSLLEYKLMERQKELLNG